MIDCLNTFVIVVTYILVLNVVISIYISGFIANFTDTILTFEFRDSVNKISKCFIHRR